MRVLLGKLTIEHQGSVDFISVLSEFLIEGDESSSQVKKYMFEITISRFLQI